MEVCKERRGIGQKDISEKLLEDYNDVFADIINVLLFHGEQRVKPEALEDAKSKSQYKADDGKLHEQERDVMKYWREGNIRLAVYGLENQTFLHAMTGDQEYEKLINNPDFKKEGASMCSVAQSLKAEGRMEERLDAIRNMIELGLTKEQILKKYSEEDYERAEQTLIVNV